MAEIANGSLVKHVSLGVGKVIAVERTAVHVFFPQSEKRFAAKLRWPAAQPLLTRDGVEPDSWLAGLTSFTLDPKSGRYALAANFLSHADAILEFFKTFPGGFTDPAYVGDGTGKRERASRWRAANSEWNRALGGGQGEQLLADGELRELVRRALRVGRLVSAVPGTVDQEVLTEALAPGEVVSEFFGALFGLLSAPSPVRARFDKLSRAADSLGVAPDLAWPMATLFPFVADPSRHALLLPKAACGAAARLGCDFRYKPAPSWVTYDAFRAFSLQLLEELRPHGALDLVDVEAFLHTVGAPTTRRKR
jgi:hypothetical protein